VELEAKAVPDDAVDFFADVNDAEVLFAGDIHAEEERIFAFLEVLEVFEDIGFFAAGEEIVREKGAVGVGRLATVFLTPLFVVNTLGAETLEEGVAGLVAAKFFVDAFDQALLDCFLDGDMVEGPLGAESKPPRRRIGEWESG